MNKKARRKYGAENRQEKAQKASTTRKTGELTQIDDKEGPLASHNDRASGHTPKHQVSMKILGAGAVKGKLPYLYILVVVLCGRAGHPALLLGCSSVACLLSLCLPRERKFKMPAVSVLVCFLFLSLIE